jgi:serine/threonine protein phosphatase PrpC
MKSPIAFATALEGRQDRVAALEYEQGLVAVVADGAGGMGGGGEAAQQVIEAVARAGWRRSSLEWADLLQRLDGEINPGQTTAVVVAVGDEGLFGASVGDSEAWWFGAAGSRALTERQQRKPLLGAGEAVPIPFDLAEAGPGTLVAASDGLWKYLHRIALEPLLRLPPAEAARRLVESVRYPGGSLPDDVAVVVFQVGVGRGG